MTAFTVEIQGVQEVIDKLGRIALFTSDHARWGQIIADEATGVLRGAVATWKRPPAFDVRQHRGSTTTTLTINAEPVFPFGFVNAGTRPHMIFPKKAGGRLRFNTRFSAKSRPNSLKAYVGMSAPPVRFAWGVHHPGNAPRNFDRLAAAKAERDGGKKVQDDIARLLAGKEAAAQQAAARPYVPFTPVRSMMGGRR
jgi:hypothetical protein